MAGGARPGSQCAHGARTGIDDGTSCRQPSPRPGAVGIADKGWSSFLPKQVTELSTGVGAWVDRATSTAGGHARSVLLSIVDLLPVKPDSPFSTALLKHYVERSGEPYVLAQIPKAWQDWIVAATKGRVGRHRALNPYNSGLYDLRNSLGHFDVEVKANRDGTKTFLISDTYQFGAMANDSAQRGRHGFPVGELTSWQIEALKGLIPVDEYRNPGGFRERWEIKTVGKETILFIPQQYLAAQGTPFQVTGSFTR